MDTSKLSKALCIVITIIIFIVMCAVFIAIPYTKGILATKYDDTDRSPMECNMQSILIDDDAEYHITAIDPKGNIIVFDDVDSEDVSIITSRTNEFTIKADNRAFKDKFWIIGATIKIPIDYRIERFND